MFFKKKPKLVLRWVYSNGKLGCDTLTVIVKSIKRLRWSPFGVKNTKGAFSYVPHAMQISGQIKSSEISDIDKEDPSLVILLAPEDECIGIKPGDVLKASLLEPTKLFKLEKVS